MIYVKVWQPKGYPLIEIQLSHSDEPFAGHIAARKGVNVDFEMTPACVKPNISYQGEFTPEQARDIADLWRVAAKTTETLDLMVTCRDDLTRPISAKMKVKTVVPDWQGSEE